MMVGYGMMTRPAVVVLTTDCENNDDSGRGVQVLKNRSRTFVRGTLVLCAQMEHGEAVPRSGGTGLF